MMLKTAYEETNSHQLSSEEAVRILLFSVKMPKLKSGHYKITKPPQNGGHTAK